MTSETEAIRARYSRRDRGRDAHRYSALNPGVLMSIQERERALSRLIRGWDLEPVDRLRVLEIGCGTGRNLFEFLRLGFRPENLVGNDLLEERLTAAAALLPPSVRFLDGDALTLPCEKDSFDIVLQSTVFTSILDPAFQQALAARIWDWVAPGGGVLWYDFVYKNPANPDVRGIPLRRIRELFPVGEFWHQRLTLAPPISRVVTRVHPAFYTLLNLFPFLRTHALCWIRKPA